MIQASDSIDVSIINWDGIDMTEFIKIECNGKKRNSLTLIKPETLNVSMSLYRICINCKIRVTVPLREQKFPCESCYRRIVVKRLWIGFL